MAIEPALVMSPEAPYPIAGGGATRTASILHYLARTRPVDLIVFRQPGTPDPGSLVPPGLLRRVSAIPLPPHSRGKVARVVRNSSRLVRRVPPLVDRFAGFESQMAAAVEGMRYGVGVIEHSWCAPYWEQIAPVCRWTVLDLHNIESQLHARCAAAEEGGTAFAHRLFADASREFEKAWLPRFSELLATSENDAATLRGMAPSTPITVYPNAIPETPLPPPGDENVVIFSGNLEYHPNCSAVRFFRGEIWPILRRRWPDLVWRLVGKNPGAVREFIADDPRIEVTGPVENAVAELARARVAVVPLLAGSGTRLKILEAWAAGLPVVSTTLGAEGLPARADEDLLLADTAADFAAAVSRLLENADLRRRLAHAGRTLVEKELTWPAVWKKLHL